jgi:hypothetical protein
LAASVSASALSGPFTVPRAAADCTDDADTPSAVSVPSTLGSPAGSVTVVFRTTLPTDAVPGTDTPCIVTMRRAA